MIDRKHLSQRIAFGIFRLLSLTVVGILFAILGFIIYKGVGVIYMNEYAPKGWVVRFIRMMTNNLSGIPSIVFGLFGMALFVNYMGFGDSILAGSLTLGLLCVPLVIRTTEEALKAIPDTLREGSRALGATKLQTIWHVVLLISFRNSPQVYSTSVWHCPIICMLFLPVAQIWMPSFHWLMAQL